MRRGITGDFSRDLIRETGGIGPIIMRRHTLYVVIYDRYVVWTRARSTLIRMTNRRGDVFRGGGRALYTYLHAGQKRKSAATRPITIIIIIINIIIIAEINDRANSPPRSVSRSRSNAVLSSDRWVTRGGGGGGGRSRTILNLLSCNNNTRNPTRPAQFILAVRGWRHRGLRVQKT